MPELDGFKVVEQIRKLERKLGQKEVAILGLSADVTGEVQDRYKLEEVGDYLGKPFKMGENESWVGLSFENGSKSFKNS